MEINSQTRPSLFWEYQRFRKKKQKKIKISFQNSAPSRLGRNEKKRIEGAGLETVNVQFSPKRELHKSCKR